MRHARGLGLLELLVALVLVTLAATLVIAGIGQGLGLLQRTAADQGAAYHELMARAWLRESIAAVAPPTSTVADDGTEQEDTAPPADQPPSPPVFTGSTGVIEMQSFRPLLGAEGVATPIRWSADARQGLLYEEGDQQVLVDALPPLQRIEYQDAEGNWQPQWPPPEAQQREGTQPVSALPVRVRFEFPGDDRLDVLLLARLSPRTDEEGAEVGVD